jgi:aminopeptidase N
MQKAPRLLEQFIPINYNLTVDLRRVERTFIGKVLISGKAITESNCIKLHAKKLDIQSVTIDNIIVPYTYGDFDELSLTINTQKDKTYEILINFTGKIDDSMHGLYPCYFEHNGVKKELLATQFESHHAREVFPCIDEPAAKATFDVTLITEDNIIVLGNMPIIEQTKNNDNRLLTKFSTTPIMSSYLLAWVVGELHKKTAMTKSNVEVNVWATPAQSPETLDFALDIATRSIDFYDEYFGTPYPLTKCDHVALPDFSCGAMENWGLITYREIALLDDPKSSSISNKHYIATVITHELSHQWFGNLVTMQWWNDLWLNESFASLIEYTALDALEPEWTVWMDFASYDSIVALKRDAVAGVQSVQTDVNHPDEISTLFDGAIVYSKGARLMQMLQKYIGEDAFRTGLRNYFKKYAYKNTVAADLWNEFSEVSGIDIASFMNQWISQPGYPVLHVQEIDDQILLSQNRLTSLKSEKSNSLWPIPLNSNSDQIPKLFEKESELVFIEDTSSLRFNVGSFAHFITHYSHTLLSQITEELKAGKLSPIDRLQILNEQSILANAGVISSAELVNLLMAYKNEDVESVWDIIGLTIGELKKYVANNKEAERKLKSLTYQLIQNQYTKLGWTSMANESEADTKLRNAILSLMMYTEDESAANIALETFRAAPIPDLNPELRSLLISNAVKNEKNIDNIKPIIELYSTTNDTSLQQDICAGLTSVREPSVALYILELIKNPEIVRPQDVSRWIIYLIRNKSTKDISWSWLRDNWEWIKITFAGDKSYDDYPRYSASALMTQKQLDEYKEFFIPMLEIPSLKRVITMGINEITDRIEIIERDQNAVCEALINL